jgi:deazaflavin-dependent oxidoreductase (nitroreductase family)
MPVNTIDIPPRGTRGARMPRLPGGLMRFINDSMFRFYRDRSFRNGRVLMLTTTGAHSGQPRRNPVMYFDEASDTWLITASAGGAATHPAWFFNLAKHPDQVWAEIGHRKIKVTPETLTGDERARAWQRITTQSPGFRQYETTTDREIPVIRLRATT